MGVGGRSSGVAQETASLTLGVSRRASQSSRTAEYNLDFAAGWTSPSLPPAASLHIAHLTAVSAPTTSPPASAGVGEDLCC